MNILVTGATGFVGRPLCLRLLREGLGVRAALRSPSAGRSLPQGVEPALVGPIGPDSEWRPALEGVDVVVHLAARTHVMHEEERDPLQAYRLVNVQGTEKLARAAAASGVKRFVYLSSVKVNGEGRPVPYTEDDTPAPEDAYGVTKWEAEQMLSGLGTVSGMEIIILRPPLVYGPGVKANFLQLVKTVNRGIPLPLSLIRNKRSLVYLENLVDAIMICISRPEAAGRTYLVSDGEDLSTPELIEKIATSLGRPPRLFPFPARGMRMLGRLSGKSAAVDRLLGSLTIDTSKIREELGWRPPYTMDQGLRETAEWFKGQRAESRKGHRA